MAAVCSAPRSKCIEAPEGARIKFSNARTHPQDGGATERACAVASVTSCGLSTRSEDFERRLTVQSSTSVHGAKRLFGSLRVVREKPTKRAGDVWGQTNHTGQRPKRCVSDRASQSARCSCPASLCVHERTRKGDLRDSSTGNRRPSFAGRRSRWVSTQSRRTRRLQSGSVRSCRSRLGSRRRPYCRLLPSLYRRAPRSGWS